MKGIWRHASLFEGLDRPELSLGEGDTPLQPLDALAAELGLDSLHLKREDRNPGGSHKDRGLLYQVAAQPGAGSTLVISSSGNAATSGAAACRAAGHRLVAFVSPATNPSKLARIEAAGGLLLSCPKPINFAKYAARVFGLRNLRGTADPLASVGYRSLAGELAEARPDAVLTFSSSGVSLTGMADGFDRLEAGPALWAVQSGLCLGIARALEPDLPDDPRSPAGRLGVRNPPGAAALAERLVGTGGGAVAVSGAEVTSGGEQLRELGVEASPEGAAVLAAVRRLARSGRLRGRVVAVVTGRAHPEGDPAPDMPSVDSYLAVRAFLQQLGLEPVS